MMISPFEDYTFPVDYPSFVERMRDHHRSRIDDNQKEVVETFRKLGWYVLHTHDLKNACDLMVVKKGRVVAVEIKDGSKIPSKRKLSKGELEFRLDWEGNGGEWRLVETLDQVLQINKGAGTTPPP